MAEAQQTVIKQKEVACPYSQVKMKRNISPGKNWSGGDRSLSRPKQ
jgi:hypothetical protein